MYSCRPANLNVQPKCVDIVSLHNTIKSHKFLKYCEICCISSKFASIQFPGVKDQVSQEPWSNLNFWINSYIYNILYVQLWSILVHIISCYVKMDKTSWTSPSSKKLSSLLSRRNNFYCDIGISGHLSWYDQDLDPFQS